LAEVISRIIQAVLGDLIPLDSIVQHGPRPFPWRRSKKSRLIVAGGWWSLDTYRLHGQYSRTGQRAPLSDHKSLGQSRGEIVIVLSAAGHLIALLHEIQMCAAGIRGRKKAWSRTSGARLRYVRLHV